MVGETFEVFDLSRVCSTAAPACGEQEGEGFSLVVFVLEA